MSVLRHDDQLGKQRFWHLSRHSPLAERAIKVSEDCETKSTQNIEERALTRSCDPDLLKFWECRARRWEQLPDWGAEDPQIF